MRQNNRKLYGLAQGGQRTPKTKLKETTDGNCTDWPRGP